MAVTEQIPRNVSTATAGAIVFPYDFKVLAKEDMLVQVNGVTKTVDVDFTLSGVGLDAGGNITFTTPLIGGETVMRKREMTLSRTNDFQSMGDLRSPTLNNDQDAPVMMLQQLNEAALRSIRLSLDSTASAQLPPLTPLAPLVVKADGSGFEMGSTTLTGDMLLRGNLADTAAGKGAALSGYTPTSTGVVGTVFSFLESLWTAGAATGAALIRFLPLGVSAVGRTLQGKVRERVSVTDFMSPTLIADSQLATPVLDHTAAFQAAAAACIGAADSHLHLPRGRYRVGAEVLTQFSGVISGAGTQDTIIYTTNATANLFSTVDSFGSLVVRDLQINSTVTRTAGAAFYINTATPSSSAQARLRLDNVAIYNQYKGVEILNAGYWSITHCWFYDCVQYSVYSDCTHNFDAGDNTITGCLFTASNTTCDHIRLINNCRVINNKVLGGLKGIHVEPSAVAGTRVDFQITGNSLENQWTHGIHFNVTNAATGIANSTIIGNQIAAMNNAAQCVAINGPIGGLVINANVCVLAATNTVGIATVGNGVGAPGTLLVTNNLITGGPAGSTGIYAGSSATIVSGNLVASAATPYTSADAGVTFLNTTFTFATLPTPVANGSVVYCSNGTVANPVASGGTGCIAKRLNGVWVGN